MSAQHLAGVAPEIIAFYTSSFDEAERLSGTAEGVLELVRTRELLGRCLPPPPARVLDVGGGTGAHARWLVQDGYQVHLVDPVERHLAQAQQTGCTVELGEAGALTAGDASYDVVLLLGPLYHLPDRNDRRQALREAYRVVRPGGLVAAAAINRYASLFDTTATTHLAHPPVQAAVEHILATGVHDGRKGFTVSAFHTAPELVDELAAAGLVDVAVHGIEGPGWAALRAVEQHTGTALFDSPLFTAALAAARIAESHPDLLAAGSHLLAVGHRP
jgi:2-polyprenyl-3-methyl-5-hydroxy-6-metoxy-1,4-benzoquinol methylase